jgi:hypothetical protein
MQTWKQWLEGEALGTVWGLRVYWWARIGKLAQLLGALTILAEIIGPARLRSFSASLRTLRAARWALGVLRDSAGWLVAFFRYQFGKSERRDKRLREMEQFGTNIPATVLYLGIALVIAVRLWDNTQTTMDNLFHGLLAGSCITVVATPLIVLFVALVLASCAIVVGLVVRPVAWVLERPALEKVAKVASLLLVLVGAFLELLAS